MMHELEKSDPFEVAKKPANDVDGPPLELVERRDGAKGNTNKTRMRRTPSRESVSPGLARVRERAKQQKKERFTALFHHVDIDLLRTAFFRLKRDAAPGIDGLTWREYEHALEVRLVDLHARLHSGAYRALPSRRKFIPKGNGQRPLGVATVNANYTFKQYSFGMGRDLPSFSPLAGPTFPGVEDATVIGSGDVDFARSDAWDTQCAARVDRLGGALAIGAGWAATAAFCLGGAAGVGEAGGQPPPGD